MFTKENSYIGSFFDRLIHEKQYSPNTIKVYKYDIQHFLEFSKKHHILWDSLSPQEVSSWLDSLYGAKLSSKSIARKLSALRSLFEFLVKTKKIIRNPFLLFSAPKSKKIIPTTFSSQEMLSLLNNMPVQTIVERRNKVMLTLMYATGIRSEEVCSLLYEHVFLKQKTIKVMGKGKKERFIPVIPVALKEIELWIQERNYIDKGIDNTLFLSKNGRKLTTAMIRKIVYRFSESNLNSAGKHFHPHAFRYTFASHLLDNNANLRHIQELLGHANLSVTQRYTKISIENLKQKYIQFHPRAK